MHSVCRSHGLDDLRLQAIGLHPLAVVETTIRGLDYGGNLARTLEFKPLTGIRDASVILVKRPRLSFFGPHCLQTRRIVEALLR